jgi:D-alanyl-lipoteichoic acid acyltransferase DltB (MBOAT superfamily)
LTFTSFNFLLLLPLIVALYQVVPPRSRSCYLLAVSYAFYCTWSLGGAVALAVATFLTFQAGKVVGDPASERRGRRVFLVAIVLLVAYLSIFKIAAAVPLGGLAGIALPLGLSYYTFKLMSYIIDIYWGKIEPATNGVEFAAAIAFFPQLSAGPIQRPGDFLKQVPPKQTMIWQGLARVVWGLGKKMLIADSLAPAVNFVYSHISGPQPTNLHGAGLLAGFYLFPLQLYADFSALTDIALGIGMMFGIQGPENFNRPFTASSISDFWRRWHMSLTNWLADYVFTPLRMATRSAGTLGLVFSITANMVAIGLWHGLTWGYLMFGVIHSGYLVVDALTTRGRAAFFKTRPGWNRLGNWAGWLLTFHLVLIALVFFRAHSVSDAVRLLTHAWLGLTHAKRDLAPLLAAAGSKVLLMGLAGYAALEVAERLRPDQWWLRIELAVPIWLRKTVQFAACAFLVTTLVLLTIRSASHASTFLYQVF